MIYQQTNDVDEVGRPDGGMVSGQGFNIAWQCQGTERNGATVADVLDACMDRLAHLAQVTELRGYYAALLHGYYAAVELLGQGRSDLDDPEVTQ